MKTHVAGLLSRLLLGTCLAMFLTSVSRGADASVVKLVQHEDKWQLLRNGQPYVIHGAGGSGSMALLAKSGGNSVRTWSVDNLKNKLDEAQALGITVTVGFWLGQPQQGFDYEDSVQVTKQMEQIRKIVYRYRNHPAVLIWCLGNEAEGWEQGDDPTYWHALNDLGAMVKKMDPNHPTMTVTAEIGGERVSCLNEFCPDIDIHGINSYGGCPNLPERYRKAGGRKPYIVTEFGPAGQWEATKTAFGTPPEATSTEKAAHYKLSYEKGIQPELGKLCLGSYAFLWGYKTEATATWYGMFLPDGARVAAVDTMTEIWSGKPVAVACPTIDSLTLEGSDDVAPGTLVKATLKAGSPSGDPLSVKWALYTEEHPYALGEAGVDDRVIFPDALVKSSTTEAEFKMPQGGGAYRLCVYVHDQHGGAATGNLCIHVKGPEVALKFPGQKVKLPMQIVGANAPETFEPTGTMGNSKDFALDFGCMNKPHSGATCLEVVYKVPDNWAGVVWQSPPGDWGEVPGGCDLTGATRLTFWARGAKGGEKVSFGYGVLKDKKFNDSSGNETPLTLTNEWKQYTIDLAGKDLTCIKSGFLCSVPGQGAKVVFYLDSVQYEK